MKELRASQAKTDEQIEKLRVSQAKTDEQQQENALQLKEGRIAFEQGMKELRESQAKTDEQMKKTDEQLKKLEEEVDRVSSNVGGLNHRMGDLTEALFAPKIWEKFHAYPYDLKHLRHEIIIHDEVTKKELTDIDILLSGSEWAMVVEVKTKANVGDVTHHIGRMSIVRKYPPAEAKGKKLLGAIAAGFITEDALALAHDSGFFVLQLTGESNELLPLPEGFSPKEWQ
jgi:hypothetical protein